MRTERAAKELWARRPEFIREYTDTAREICDAVAAELPTIAKPPKNHERVDLTDPKKRDQFIDLLRSRVKRIKVEDDFIYIRG